MLVCVPLGYFFFHDVYNVAKMKKDHQSAISLNELCYVIEGMPAAEPSCVNVLSLIERLNVLGRHSLNQDVSFN